MKPEGCVVMHECIIPYSTSRGVKPGFWTHGLDYGLDCGLRFGLNFGLMLSSMTTISRSEGNTTVLTRSLPGGYL